MPDAALALLLFASWTLFLLMAVVTARIMAVMTGKKKANEFPGGKQHGGDRYWRLNRAHANCLEFLPIFGVVVLAALMTDAYYGLFGTLALVIIPARIVQSCIQIMSGSSLAVNLRATAFFVQIIAVIWMIYLILSQNGMI